MFELLLDSSNKYLTVALAKDGVLYDSIFYEAWQRQSEVMVSEIDNILNRNKVAKEELNAIVVGVGPGSYTGVRISLTIAKVMAYSLKIKLYKVSSLSLLKHGNLPTICLFNARSGRSYFAVYEGEKQLVADKVLPNEEVAKYIDEHPDFLLSGDSDVFNKESVEYNIPLNLANSINDKNLVKDIFSLNPIYLKDLVK